MNLNIEQALKAYADAYFAGEAFVVEVRGETSDVDLDPTKEFLIFAVELNWSVGPLYVAELEVRVETPAFSDQTSLVRHREVVDKAGIDWLFSQANKVQLDAALQVEGFGLTGGTSFSTGDWRSLNDGQKWVSAMAVKMGVEKQ
ncbi:MAG: hypothetical protein QM496_01955 [Verrucomicrobiota bacterium]